MLDPRRMRRDGEHWLLTCPDCEFTFPVRLSDPYLPVTAEMEAAANRQPPAKPKGNGKLRKFLVGH